MTDNNEVAELKGMALGISPYMTTRQGRFNWYHYLHIQGGTGNMSGNGGQYAFYLTYLAPEEDRIIDKAMDHYCKERSIPCGVGKTIAEAHEDFQNKLKETPLK